MFGTAQEIVFLRIDNDRMLGEAAPISHYLNQLDNPHDCVFKVVLKGTRSFQGEECFKIGENYEMRVIVKVGEKRGYAVTNIKPRDKVSTLMKRLTDEIMAD